MGENGGDPVPRSTDAQKNFPGAASSLIKDVERHGYLQDFLTAMLHACRQMAEKRPCSRFSLSRCTFDGAFPHTNSHHPSFTLLFEVLCL